MIIGTVSHMEFISIEWINGEILLLYNIDKYLIINYLRENLAYPSMLFMNIHSLRETGVSTFSSKPSIIKFHYLKQFLRWNLHIEFFINATMEMCKFIPFLEIENQCSSVSRNPDMYHHCPYFLIITFSHLLTFPSSHSPFFRE